MGKNSEDDEGVSSPERSPDKGEGEEESSLEDGAEESTAEMRYPACFQLGGF